MQVCSLFSFKTFYWYVNDFHSGLELHIHLPIWKIKTQLSIDRYIFVFLKLCKLKRKIGLESHKLWIFITRLAAQKLLRTGCYSYTSPSFLFYYSFCLITQDTMGSKCFFKFIYKSLMFSWVYAKRYKNISWNPRSKEKAKLF